MLVTLNGTIMSGARVPFAMSRDGYFFKSLAAPNWSARVVPRMNRNRPSFSNDSTRHSRSGDLADVLRREIRLAANDEQIVALQFRLGQLFEQNLRDVDSAIGVYDEILKADGGHAPTLAAQSPMRMVGRVLGSLPCHAGKWSWLLSHGERS